MSEMHVFFLLFLMCRNFSSEFKQKIKHSSHIDYEILSYISRMMTQNFTIHEGIEIIINKQSRKRITHLNIQCQKLAR